MRNAPHNPAPSVPGRPGTRTDELGSQALEPPALRGAAEAVEREFPLVVRRTGLVLYDVDPQHLQAQWQVTADDLNRARNAFPPGAAGVRPILRLLRLDAEGGPKEVAALPQPPAAGLLEGEAVLTVGDQGRRFQAELGLASGDGGWLLLARSDPVEPPRPIVRTVLVRQPPTVRPVEPAPVSPAALRPAMEPVVSPAAKPAPAPAAPVPRPSEAALGEPPALDLTLAPPAIPLAPQFPNPLEARPAEGPSEGRREATAQFRIPHSAVRSQDEGQAPRGEGVGQLGMETGTALPAPQSAIRNPQSDASLPPPVLPSTLDTWSGEGGLLAHHDPTHGLSSRALHGPAPGEVELHAELVVWGHAPAGSLVEVLGRRLRVGPDGRFLVRSGVDDPGAFGIALSGTAEGEPGERGAE